MSETRRRATRRTVQVRTIQTLHQLLDLVRRDESALIVADIVWMQRRHRVMGRLADGDGYAAPFAPVVIRCGPGKRSIRTGMSLRLWRDETGAYLEHCVP
jgi:hypothetical protein